ncbi:acyltransferase [Actinorhabdospora filicis]|uniref:Acyltransferase n=1 Tax=Actinorhabdospora filicis TaxID=1785913 RepID=A0A9W6SK31_9ACTN|nr:acyltransferase [Actinorhabdospora filicis]GLZ77131.1 acyltransferase [Actinorhabdospora filicis]
MLKPLREQSISPGHLPSVLPSLTGMRWFAALLVFGLHLNVVGYFDPDGAGRVVRAMFGAGGTGVSFFFVLSGFVLAWSARPGDSAVRFWRRRFARVYPLHLVTAGLALVLALFLIPDMIPAPDVAIANLGLVHSWLGDQYDQSLNPVSWSLACEALFYLAFPLLYAGIRRLRTPGVWAVAGLSVALVAVTPLVLEARMVYFFAPARLAEFVLGIALAVLVRTGAWRGLGYPVALAALAAGYVGAAFEPGSFRYAACTLPGFALLIAAGAASDVDGRRSWMASPLMVRLGELSFAFYMVHILVMRTGEYLWRSHPELGALPAIGLTLLSGTIALACSWALHTCVEVPGRRLLLPRKGRRPRPLAGTAFEGARGA